MMINSFHSNSDPKYNVKMMVSKIRKNAYFKLFFWKSDGNKVALCQRIILNNESSYTQNVFFIVL